MPTVDEGPTRRALMDPIDDEIQHQIDTFRTVKTWEELCEPVGNQVWPLVVAIKESAAEALKCLP